ncbi:MAG TPA: dihydroorotate dehydrogenase-like protein [Bacteroidales bacterium]|nr:dihydroorotate dehydrogenase-like protein [Bacteroidales bacterium]
MVNLRTKYMGLELKNPIIVASSGLTKTVDKIIEFESKGAGAVVLKSLFEEQIMFETNHIMDYPESYNSYPEALDYISNFTKHNSVDEYLKLIRDAKKEVKIPVFGSINCVSLNEWTSIARDIEKAGADALELNIFIMPSDLNLTGAEHEKMYFDIIERIKNTIKIPVAIKVGYYFSGLVNLLQKFSWTGIGALVLFNRFYTPDINIDTLHLQATNILSTPAEIGNSLRWIAMLSDKAGCDISASTGIHDASGVIKQLLVGATTTQLCSTLYLNGAGRIQEILEDLTKWMEHKNYNQISDFRGKLSLNKAENPVMYHRVQYMKHLSDTD